MKLDNMLGEFDELECVMIASGEDLLDESGDIDDDVEDIEDDDEDDYYDETIEDICSTFTIEDEEANDYRITRDFGMDDYATDLIDNNMMDIDDDVEDIEDDDDEDD